MIRKALRCPLVPDDDDDGDVNANVGTDVSAPHESPAHGLRVVGTPSL